MRHRSAKYVAFATAAGLLLATAAGAGIANADVGSQSKSGGETKNEIVYVKTDASGKTRGVYVVNVFNADEKRTVDDPSRYTKVTNLTTDRQLSQKNGHVSVETTADQPFYYQGDMPADTELPWNITVGYALDGKPIDPDDLAGRSGDLDVTLTVTADTAAANVKDFAEAYVLQAQGTFPADSYDITDGGGATLATAGGNTVVSAMVLPGESKTFRIQGTAKDFQYSGWQIAAMSLDMAIDIRSQDTSKLTDQTDRLEQATDRLSDGSKELADGNAQLASGAAQLDDGLVSLADGAGKVDSGASSLASGAGTLSSGIGTVAQGASSLASGTGALASGASRLASGVHTLTGAVSDLSAAAPQLKSGADTLAYQLAQSSDDAAHPTLKDGWGSVRGGITQVKQGGDRYRAALQQGRQSAEAGSQTAGQQVAEASQAYQTALQSFAANPQSAEAQQALNQALQAFAQANQAAGAYAGSAKAMEQAESGYDQLGAGIDTLNAGAATLDVQFDAAREGTVANGAKQLASVVDSVATGLGSMPADSLRQLDSAADQVAAGAAQVNTGAGRLAKGAEGLRSGGAALASGANALANGTNGLNAGARSASEGASQLVSGARSASSGAKTLADGNAALAESVQGMGDEVLDELQKTIDRKLGADFKPHSFVVPTNTNVNRVQFTYVVAGVDSDTAANDAADGGDAASVDDSSDGSAESSDAGSKGSDSGTGSDSGFAALLERIKALFSH
ncbi:methyl-accepting chemotaxis protein [Bifidobacterium margollesii]|uniref:Methyl-accepting chemotaxis protein n=1 Tax=Bifidobacterium margollesii TaxID=2020964 RepID=A0A2N5JCN6_9BIFI|nr:hypothetical protein [Bifidobacterium margollesii]PLS31964.1 methyl-accepting chemotaxis protein [Bifidobacterium margollesii]